MTMSTTIEYKDKQGKVLNKEQLSPTDDYTEITRIRGQVKMENHFRDQYLNM